MSSPPISSSPTDAGPALAAATLRMAGLTEASCPVCMRHLWRAPGQCVAGPGQGLAFEQIEQNGASFLIHHSPEQCRAGRMAEWSATVEWEEVEDHQTQED